MPDPRCGCRDVHDIDDAAAIGAHDMVVLVPLPPDEAEHGFELFKNKQDNREKVVLKP